jgi:hypothetical protein
VLSRGTAEAVPLTVRAAGESWGELSETQIPFGNDKQKSKDKGKTQGPD